ncbi:MAG: DUF924 family protein [Sulfuricaulis sp.]|uniref:DUF924 family protein n=1 Tax=Sulfuricaulis sp. TaxID=2003553 RepID=UPI0034A5CE1C
MEDVESILHYWFGGAANNAEIVREKSALWWKKDPGVDAEIRRRFEMMLDAEIKDEFASWSSSPRGQLARVLLCDQFPRNMYRDSPRAFDYDERARKLAREALDAGRDKKLRPVERVFLFLPFEHSEAVDDQVLGLRLYTALVEDVPETDRPTYQKFLEFARKHKEIIDRFGRFPHRNAILGRQSTAAEAEFLKGPGSSF